MRRKIRPIECKAKCRYLKKLTCKGTLWQVFYLSEAPLPSYDPILLPPLHTVYVYTTGRKCENVNVTVYLQSINSIKHVKTTLRVLCLYSGTSIAVP